MKTLIQMIASLACHSNKDTAEEMAEYISRRMLPSGSGFDKGTVFDVDHSTRDKLVFHTSYHHMSDHGYYTKWTDHTVTVTPSFHGFYIKVSGRNHNDIKDYIADTFHHLLGDESIDMGALTRRYVQIAKTKNRRGKK